MRAEDHVAQIRALLREAVPCPTPQYRREVGTFDAITRLSHLQRIRYLARAYFLQWLVDQATFDLPGLDALEDHELVALHQDMDRAVECMRDGVSFDDAGLFRPKT